MANPDDTHLSAARDALAGRRLDEAARELALHLEARPADVEAEIALGLVELMRGQRGRFAASHEALAARLAASPPSEPGPWQGLWERSRALAQSTARAAAILALAGLPVPAGLAGCSQPSAPAEHHGDAAAEASEAGSPRPAPTTSGAAAPDEATPAPDAAPPPPRPSPPDAAPPAAQDAGPAGAPAPPAQGSAPRPGARDAGPAGAASASASAEEDGAVGHEAAPAPRPRPRPRPLTRYIAHRPLPIPSQGGSGESNDPDDL